MKTMGRYKAFGAILTSNIWAKAVLCLLLGLSLQSQATALQCSSLFLPHSDLLIAMNPKYRGENEGRYLDPITKNPWRVKYLAGAERRQYEVLWKDGRFVNQQGKKIESEFDPESMSFDNGLFVIDKNFRMFLLPFESRGEYHHSSLSRGEDVIFAGTAAFSNGVLRELSNSSGHYKPSAEHTRTVLLELKKRGIDLSQTKLRGQAARDLKNSFSVSPKELTELLAEP